MFITAYCPVILRLFNRKMTNRTSAGEYNTDASLSCSCRQSGTGKGVLHVMMAARPGMAQLGLFSPPGDHGSPVLTQYQGLSLVVRHMVLGASGFQYCNATQ